MSYGIALRISWIKKGLALSHFMAFSQNLGLLIEDGAGSLLLLDPKTGSVKTRFSVAFRAVDVATGDISGDGVEKFVLATSDGLYILSSLELEKLAVPLIPVKVLVDDFDGDGLQEIFVIDASATGNLLKEGRVLARMPFERPILYVGLLDVDGDGVKELVSLYAQGTFDVYKLREQKLMKHGEFFFGAFRRALPHDINGDGAEELLILDGSSLRVIDFSGPSLEDLFQVPEEARDFLLLDIDGDGAKELLFALTEGLGSKVLLFSLPDFDLEIDAPLDTQLAKLYSADINGDGKMEVVALDVHGSIYLLDEAGLVDKFRLEDDILRVLIADADKDSVDEVFVRTKYSVACLKRF